MSKKSISLFFGAGAEVSYGLPTGGKFALNIFRMENDTDREKFREQIKGLDPKSQISNEWLPNRYGTKRLSAFGKREFEKLVISSFEYKRVNILEYLNDFDNKVSEFLSSWSINEDMLNSKYKEITNEDIGTTNYNQAIQLNEKLDRNVKLFSSDYFSAFLKILELNKEEAYLKRIVRSFLELLIGSLGHNLITNLNEDLFIEAPDNFSIFDDLAGFFH